jgi:hypothetical protein
MRLKNIYIFLILISFVELKADFEIKTQYYKYNHSSIEQKEGTTNTGDELREWIKNNASAYATVIGRSIIFHNAWLKVNGNLRDSMAIYQFTGTNRLDVYSKGEMHFKDLTVHFTGNARGAIQDNISERITAYWTRVNIVEGSPGETQVFNNGDFNFFLKDVNMVGYGKQHEGDKGDFYHFQTNDTSENISVVSPDGNLNIEPGAWAANDVQVIKGLKLRGVKNIVGAAGGLGSVKIYDLDWDEKVWYFKSWGIYRKIKFMLVNPIKPNGWISYDGEYSNGYNHVGRCKEYFTHDVRVLDENRNPLSGVKVYLNCYDTTIRKEYAEQTNSEGKIQQYEILKTDNAISPNYKFLNWTFTVCDYYHEYYNQIRSFDNKVDEDVVLIKDEGVTETDISKVMNYTRINTAEELYDRLKYEKVKNEASTRIPSFSEQLIKYEGGDLVLAINWNLTLDSTISNCVEIEQSTKTIKVKAQKILKSEKFYKIVATGNINLLHGASIDFPYKDQNTNSYVRIKDVMDVDTVYIKEKGVVGIKAKFVGECGYAFQSHPTDELELLLKMSNGDEVLTFFKKKEQGYNQVVRMGIDESFLLETMFMPPDRERLFSTIDSLESMLNREGGPLEQILDSVIQMNLETIKKFK